MPIPSWPSLRNESALDSIMSFKIPVTFSIIISVLIYRIFFYEITDFISLSLLRFFDANTIALSSLLTASYFEGDENDEDDEGDEKDKGDEG